MNVSEAKVATLIFVTELFVVDAQLMENRRLNVMNVNGIFMVMMFGGMNRVAIRIDNLRSVFVCVTNGDSPFDSSTGHPHRKACLMMIAPIVRFT